MQPFYLLFLYVPEDAPNFAFRIRLRPDPEQLCASTEPTVMISLSGDEEELTRCLIVLGVTGYSPFHAETSDGPILEYIERTPTDIVASMRAKPLSGVNHLTLIAKDTTTDTMCSRLNSLLGMVSDSIEIVGLD